MKKIGTILEELGFNKDASMSSKASFIKYLAKQAYNVNLEIPDIYKPTSEVGDRSIDALFEKRAQKEEAHKLEDQLEFSFDEVSNK